MVVVSSNNEGEILSVSGDLDALDVMEPGEQAWRCAVKRCGKMKRRKHTVNTVSSQFHKSNCEESTSSGTSVPVCGRDFRGKTEKRIPPLNVECISRLKFIA